MLPFMSFARRVCSLILHVCQAIVPRGMDGLRFLGLVLRSRTALAAENLFLRKQLALYRERQVKPRRASDAMRVALVRLARFFAWKQALLIGQPATLIRWHRQGLRLLWRWRSNPGAGRGSRRTCEPSSAGWRRRTQPGAKDGSQRNCA